MLINIQYDLLVFASIGNRVNCRHYVYRCYQRGITHHFFSIKKLISHKNAFLQHFVGSTVAVTGVVCTREGGGEGEGGATLITLHALCAANETAANNAHWSSSFDHLKHGLTASSYVLQLTALY